MAREKRGRNEKGRKPSGDSTAARGVSPETGFSAANIRILIVSIVVIIAGFVLLSRGSVTLAPILLVLGYCVLVPISIIYRSRGGGDGRDR